MFEPRIFFTNLVASCARKLGLGSRYLLPFVRFVENSDNGEILILCQGNICRSAYAEARCRAILQRFPVPGVSVKSAGVTTRQGKSADATAVGVAAERNIDLSGHRTTPVTREMLDRAGMIVIMDPYQQDAVRRLVAPALNKTIYLGAFLMADRGALVVDDPFGCPRDDFQRCFERIDSALEAMVEGLRTKRI